MHDFPLPWLGTKGYRQFYWWNLGTLHFQRIRPAAGCGHAQASATYQQKVAVLNPIVIRQQMGAPKSFTKIFQFWWCKPVKHSENWKIGEKWRRFTISPKWQRKIHVKAPSDWLCPSLSQKMVAGAKKRTIRLVLSGHHFPSFSR